jgi:hypothetical protein
MMNLLLFPRPQSVSNLRYALLIKIKVRRNAATEGKALSANTRRDLQGR